MGVFQYLSPLDGGRIHRLCAGAPPGVAPKDENDMAGVKKSRGAGKPKMKTNRGAAKRFSVTGTGKVKFGAKGMRHGLSNKSRKVKRQKRKARYMTSGDVKLVSRQIPYAL